jgi:hypothetical protein
MFNNTKQYRHWFWSGIQFTNHMVPKSEIRVQIFLVESSECVGIDCEWAKRG